MLQKQLLFAVTMSMICMLAPADASEIEVEIAALERKADLALSLVRKQLDLDNLAAFDRGEEFAVPDDFVRRIRRPYGQLEAVVERAGGLRRRLQASSAASTDSRVVRLDKLARKAGRVVGSPDRFKKGAKWRGTLYCKDRAHQVELLIEQAHGHSFAGEFVETGTYGRPIRIRFQGEQLGTVVSLETGATTFGPFCSRCGQGQVFRNQLSANVRMIDSEGKRMVAGVGQLQLTFAASGAER